MTGEAERETVGRPKRKRRAAGWLLGVFALVFLGWGVKTFYDAGEFKSIQPHFAGDIQTIDGVIGGEDITIDHANKIALISADDRFGRLSGKADAVGALYRLDFQDRGAQPKELSREPNDQISPHGISLVTLSDGRRLLYVVDHSASPSDPPANRILLYEFDGDHSLTLLKTYTDATHAISPNDVAGVDENRFYFTNDHGSTSQVGKMFEDYLQLARSNVVYFDGHSYRIVASGIAHANGIAISPDGLKVYVAATVGKRIGVFDRNPEDGSLTKIDEIKLETGVDNIELDESGNLWVGCHPKLLTFVRYSKDTIHRRSPSQVYKISKNGDAWKSEEVLLDDGTHLSGSAVAAVSGDIMLVGPVFDRKILRCELKPSD